MDSDSERTVIWSKGDKCLAKFSGDGEYYEAVIVKFDVSRDGQKKALVAFDGFGKEDNELVNLSSLKEKVCARKTKDVVCLGTTEEVSDIQTMSFVADAEQEKRRLKAKYSILDEEEKYDRKCKIQNIRATPRGKEEEAWNTTKQDKGKTSKRNQGKKTARTKIAVAVGGEAKERKINSSQESTQDPDAEYTQGVPQVTPIKAPRIPTGLTSSESEGEDNGKTTMAGFSDIDMERPYFPNVIPRGKKEPFVLSGPGEKPVAQIPATMNQYLRDYQKEGITFLYKHYVKGHGAILADDMGLGKTVQVIGFISAVMGKTGTKIDVMKQKPRFIRQLSDHANLYNEDRERKPFLIIGPASVLHNWVDELETWGHFTVGKYHKNCKNQTIIDLEKNKLDIVVTTFETCRDHIDTINNFTWDAVIADEAHKIKAMKAEVTQALKKLSCQKRFGLTGTPLQNKLEEFWCILDWASPKCLGDLKTFKNKVCKVVEQGQKQEATKRELALARCAQEQLNKVKDKWMLRRTKKLIADQMPKKEELIVYCKPTPLQADIYKTIMSQPDMHYILTQHDPCECGRDAPRGRCCYKKTPEGKNLRALTFTYLHLLLKTANHIALLLPRSTESDAQKKYAKKICEEVFERHPQFLEQNREASFITLSDPEYCCKMKLLTGLLSVFRKKKSKIILFSQSTRLLDIIEQYIMSKGYEFRRLDGKTPDNKRMGIIKEFNKDPSLFLFLVSTKAGGVGLNLTGANVVIIYDPNWNPTNDLQAQDRAYRLGQTRDVKVYRLVSSGTIEETIYLRQIYKQQQANIAVEGQNAKRYFHKDELFGVGNLFLMRESDRCLTEDILKRNRRVEEGIKAYKVENYLLSTPDSEESDRGHSDTGGSEGGHSDSGSEEKEGYDGRSSGEERDKDPPPNVESDSTPVKKTYQSRTGKAKPILYNSESSDEEHNPEIPFKRFMSSKKENTDAVDSGGFHNSQAPSTSGFNKGKSQSNTPLKNHRQVGNRKLQDELDDLWDCFESVDNTVKGQRYNTPKKRMNMTGIVDKGKQNTKKASVDFKLGRTTPKKRSDVKRNIADNSVRGQRNTKKPSIDFNVSTASMFESVDRNLKSNRTKHNDKGKSKSQTEIKSTSRHKDIESSEVCGESSSEDSSGQSSRYTGSRKKPTRARELLNSTLESVTDVLENCGVTHTHHNHKVIGPSRAEDHMTKCALKDVFENHLHTQAPAMDCDPYSNSSEESDDLGAVHREKRKNSSQSCSSQTTRKITAKTTQEESVESEAPPVKRGRKKASVLQKTWSQVIGNKTVLVGQTPKAIRKQQMTAMAVFFDTDPVSLAKQLIYSKPLERLAMMKAFYGSQDPDLREVVGKMQEQRLAQESDMVEKESQSTGKRTNGKLKQLADKKKKTTAATPRGRKPIKSVKNKAVTRRGYNYLNDSSDNDNITECLTNYKQTEKHTSNNKTTVHQRVLIAETNEDNAVTIEDSARTKRKQTLQVNQKRKGSSDMSVDSGAETTSRGCRGANKRGVISNNDVVGASQRTNVEGSGKDNIGNSNKSDSKSKLGRLLRQPTLEWEDCGSGDENTQPTGLQDSSSSVGVSREEEKSSASKSSHLVKSESSNLSDLDNLNNRSKKATLKTNSKTAQEKTKSDQSDNFLDDLFF